MHSAWEAAQRNEGREPEPAKRVIIELPPNRSEEGEQKMNGNPGISKNEGRAIKQQPCSMRPESGGCLSTTLSEKVALRPIMRELCLMLCGGFMDFGDSNKTLCYEKVI